MASATRLTWDGYDRLRAKLQKLADPDASPLMDKWSDILIEGNRRGVLAGMDGNDRPMPALTYRNGEGFAGAKNRRGAAFGTTRDYRTKWDRRIPGLNNLTSREYKESTGPRLAPRYAGSRVITNLYPGYGRDEANDFTWYAEAVWFDVVSEKGYPFLHVHFDGKRAGRGKGFMMPRYDLRPVRLADRRLATAEMVKWARSLVNEMVI